MDTDYKRLISDIIQSQIHFLGLTIALGTARKTNGLLIDDSGNITSLPPSPEKAVNELIKEYESLLGSSVEVMFQDILDKYGFKPS